MFLDKNKVSSVLEEVGNHFLTVTFLTDGGELRVYNGRLNVKKGLKNNGRSEVVRKSFEDNGIVPIKISENKYKSFKLNRVISIKSLGLIWGNPVE